jgi:hypothetical protein
MKKILNKILAIILLMLTQTTQAQTNFPTGINASKGSTFAGSAVFSGSVYGCNFHYSSTEDIYIRGGLPTSTVLIGDVGSAVYLGNASGTVYSLGTFQAQKGATILNGIYASKGTNSSGSAVFGGSEYATIFHYTTTEDTYIRGGKATSNVIIGDVGTNVQIGNAAGTNYSVGHFNAQNGITASKGNNNAGSAVLYGSVYATHFNYSSTEDTYIRGGKATSNIYVADVNNNVVMGSVPSLPAGYRLYVDKGILTEKVKVAIKTSADWSDYVFEPGYLLKPLHEVEAFIKTNKHLPGVPSAEKLVTDGGIDVNKMFAAQMEKIEELTLYLIEMKKEITVLKEENKALQANINNTQNNRR